MAGADYVIVGSGINALVAAALLGRKGHKVLVIERNDRIVIQLPNCIEFATLTIACLEIGAIPVMALPA